MIISMWVLLFQVAHCFPASFRTANLRPSCSLHPVVTSDSCMSSWLTSAVATFSARLCYQRNVDKPLSMQYALNCIEVGACGGGTAAQAWAFLQSEGIPSAACIPYEGSPGFCNSTCVDGSPMELERPQGYRRVRGVPAIQMAILQAGPVQACLDIYKDFESYEGGVYTHSWGGYDRYACILLYGWQGNAWWAYVPWLEYWGDKGSGLIQMGACRVENDVWSADPL